MASDNVCFHCQEQIPKYTLLTARVDGVERAMCCLGCKAAAEFIDQNGLSRFYEHRGQLSQDRFFGQIAKLSVADLDSKDSQWSMLEDPDLSSEFVESLADGRQKIRVVIEGLYCRSCSWLIEKTVQEIIADATVLLDVAVKTMTLTFQSDQKQDGQDAGLKPLIKVLEAISLLGYQPRLLKINEVDTGHVESKAQYQKSLKRIAIAGIGMMQVMTYAVTEYFADGVMPNQYERFLLILSMLLSTLVVFYSGKPFISNAVNDLSHKRLGMDVPIALAILAAYVPSTLSVIFELGSPVYFDSAVMFVFFISLGRFVEARARHKLLSSQASITNLLPEMIHVKRMLDQQMTELEIRPEEVNAGDVMLVYANQVLAFDAEIQSGEGQCDQAIVTGESDPRWVGVGDHIYAGSRLISGHLEVKATHAWSCSTMAKIQSAIEQAQVSKLDDSWQEKVLSRYFIAGVLVLTILISGIWLLIDSSRAFEVAIAMLVVACPCAYSLASPLGKAVALNTLKTKGVLVTAPHALSVIKNRLIWFFDKTGTLTQGQASISKVISYGQENEQKCLQIVAAIEKESNHVLANSFRGIPTSLYASNIKPYLGSGISGYVGGKQYRVGKAKWVLDHVKPKLNQAAISQINESQPRIVLADEESVMALIYLEDELRPSSSAFISRLLQRKEQLAVLSGDHAKNVQSLCHKLGIEKFYADCQPQDKLDLVQAEQQKGNQVLMVGDGVNDAPVLSAADLSIGMATGSELAQSNSDIILLNGDLEKLLDIRRVAEKQSRITEQNLRWAWGYNVLALPIAAAGFFEPWLAALGMSLSSLLVVLNTGRIRS